MATLSPKAAAAGKDIGKPGKNFDKIAAKFNRAHPEEGPDAGKRVAGAILAKMRRHGMKHGTGSTHH